MKQETQYVNAAKALIDGYSCPHLFMGFLNDVQERTYDYFKAFSNEIEADHVRWTLYFLNQTAAAWVQYGSAGTEEIAYCLNEVHSHSFTKGYEIALSAMVASFIHETLKYPAQQNDWSATMGEFEPLINIGYCFKEWEKENWKDKKAA